MAMSRALLFFIFSLSALVGSINARPCGSTPAMTNWRNDMANAEERNRQMGRNGLECEPEGYHTSSNNTGSSSAAIGLIILFIFVFMFFGVAVGICCVCVKRQNAINAANLNNFSGQVVGAQRAHGTDLKSYPETKTVQKGDPGYKV